MKIGSIKPGLVDLASVSFVSTDVAEQASRYRLGVGDLLIGMTGYVGEVGLVPPTNTAPLLNQRVGKFLLDKPGLTGLPFVYCFTRQSEFKKSVEQRSHGTAQANVSLQAILSIPIAIPHRSLRERFDKVTLPLIEKRLANSCESNTLAQLRDLLLPKLISGELRVPDAEKLAEAVL